MFRTVSVFQGRIKFRTVSVFQGIIKFRTVSIFQVITRLRGLIPVMALSEGSNISIRCIGFFISTR